jgi:hypothetical protein
VTVPFLIRSIIYNPSTQQLKQESGVSHTHSTKGKDASTDSASSKSLKKHKYRSEQTRRAKSKTAIVWGLRISEWADGVKKIEVVGKERANEVQ